jgi:hypothetical protein
MGVCSPSVVVDSCLLTANFNDLWMYNITSDVWTWLSGNSTTNVPGVYGTKGVPSVNNYPGSRYAHSMIIHPSMNCLFLFGGHNGGLLHVNSV